MEGYDLHLEYVCDMVHMSWEAISEEPIARCWLIFDILPSGHMATLISNYGKVTWTRKLRKKLDFEMLFIMFKDFESTLSNKGPIQ